MKEITNQLTRSKTSISLQMLKLSIRMEALASGAMPYYSGSIFRGMLGREIRKRTCIYPDRSCNNCEYIARCAYGSIFKPNLNMLQEAQKQQLFNISPPLVIQAPRFENELWNKGEGKKIVLILFGESIYNAYHFIDQLGKIGIQFGVGSERLKYKITDIKQILNNGTTHSLLLENLQDDLFIGDHWRWEEPTENISQLFISINSPIRTQKKGALMKELDFEGFLHTCLRRVQLLATLYGEIKNPPIQEQLRDLIQSVSLINEQVKWQEWERYSAKQRTVMKLGGLVGTFQISGDLNKLLPYLQCGSVTHIGKQTIFGLGSYDIWQRVSI